MVWLPLNLSILSTHPQELSFLKMYRFALSATKTVNNLKAFHFHSAAGIISQTNFFELQKAVSMFETAYYRKLEKI